MGSNRTVAVFGAYGHTGRFVVAELVERGFAPVLSGRDAGKLRALSDAFPGLAVRTASAGDAAPLDGALAGAAAVINCAGPFATTTGPVVEAALRARIPYVGVAAEVEAVADAFALFDERARAAGTVVVPAMAFYGGLGDLLATAAMADWPGADEVSLSYALSSWHPTSGTLKAGKVSRQRRDSRRLVYADGRLELRTDQAPTGRWSFPEPVGEQDVVGEFTTADSVTIPRHLKTPAIHTHMTVGALKDLTAADAAPPEPVDERGRSAQTFLVDVVVRSGADRRRAVARGRDIYAISAPLAVEAVGRILAGQVGGYGGGVASAGELFDAPAFLRALSPHLSFELVELDGPVEPGPAGEAAPTPPSR